jgi:LacI family transcriptional regulator/LacI family purine nucleotide synthesis repressor/LacI family repressor for deo operon, udp, cdd, tsx, nupC, and nupG
MGMLKTFFMKGLSESPFITLYNEFSGVSSYSSPLGGIVLKKNATVYDIAEEAGVSISTVSRVLTGSAPVKEETRQRVQAAIEKYNFQPNALARSLTKKESMTLGFILPDITSPFFSTVFAEAEKHALSQGYIMFLCNAMNDEANESKYLRILAEKQVDGIILMGGRINKTHTSPEHAAEMHDLLESVPVVMVNGRMRGVECHIVRTNERAGIFSLVQYLAEMGHTHIGLIGGLSGITAYDMKLRAFKTAMRDYGLHYLDEWIIPTGFSVDDGTAAMEQLLHMHPCPTAVMAINDLVAIGAIKSTEHHGLRIPEDMSLTGYDDINLAALFSPGITTVNQNFVELGQTAVDVMVALLNGKNVSRETIIDTQIVIRHSCRPRYSS